MKALLKWGTYWEVASKSKGRPWEIISIGGGHETKEDAIKAAKELREDRKWCFEKETICVVKCQTVATRV